MRKSRQIIRGSDHCSNREIIPFYPYLNTFNVGSVMDKLKDEFQHTEIEFDSDLSSCSVMHISFYYLFLRLTRRKLKPAISYGREKCDLLK